MKTHNYGPNLALLAAVCSLAACTDSTPVATAPAPETEASVTPTRAIDPDKYHVCAVSPDTVGHKHSTMTGVHIELGDEVEIKTIKAATATLVCLDGDCPADPMAAASREKVLWMVGDDKNLGTVHAFAHKDSTNAPIEPTPQHLVQLKSESDIPDTCDSQKNVLMLRFCEWGADDDGNMDWLCAGGPTHAGVVHLQP